MENGPAFRELNNGRYCFIVRIIGGTQGSTDKFFKYRRAVDDVRLWNSEMV
jgi:hypothetical protein